MKSFDLSLYLVTDSEGMTEQQFLAKVELALQNGVTFLQLREKNKTTLEYLELAKKLRELTSKYNVPLIIDDRLDIALACGADGVHLGAEDMPVDVVRKIMGQNKIIGATAKTVGKALEAEQMGADYLGVGAIYPTTTKVKTVLTKIETLQAICGSIKIPVAAIGGLNAGNLDILTGSGVKGICVVSAIMKSDYAASATKKLSQKVKELLAD